jgi:hypothetical protein
MLMFCLHLQYRREQGEELAQVYMEVATEVANGVHRRG